MATARNAIVCTGGDPVDPDVLPRLPADAIVIAADSGLRLATDLGLDVDVAVGDFDSVDPELLARAEASGTAVERHPEDKDATDLELALDAAHRRGATRIVVLGGFGGRLDHLLANVMLLSSPRFAGLELTLVPGDAHVAVVSDAASLPGGPGTIVSLLPIGGAARGVTTGGLRWPLVDEDLELGTTRGVSNVVERDGASVRLRAGSLLAITFPRPTPAHDTT